MAFYVTSDKPIVRYSSSNSNSACCNVFVSSLDLQVHEGSGVGSYPFGPTAKPRIFNGVIHYETTESTSKNKPPEQPPMLYSLDTVHTATSSYFNGNSGGYGIMFDIVSIFILLALFSCCTRLNNIVATTPLLCLFIKIPKKNMVITSLDFHTNEYETVEVNVWVRHGSHLGHERDQLAWKHVCDHVQLNGQGKFTRRHS